jgi:hypothetical protein
MLFCIKFFKVVVMPVTVVEANKSVAATADPSPTHLTFHSTQCCDWFTSLTVKAQAAHEGLANANNINAIIIIFFMFAP